MPHDTLEITVPGQIWTIDSSGQNIVLVASHGPIYILNLACELLKTIEIGQTIVGRGAVIVCNDLVIVGDSAGYINTCSIESGEVQKHWRLKESPIEAMAAIEGVGIACAYIDGLIQVIDNHLGSVHQVLGSHAADVTSLFYAARDNRLVSASASDGEIRIWVLGSEQCHRIIKTPVQHIKRIESTDKFVTASRECVDIRIWHVPDGSPEAILSPPAHVRGTLTIEPYCLGGIKGILTSHRDGSIRIWDHGKGIQLYAFETGKKVDRIFPAVPLNIHQHSGEAVHRIVSGHKEGVVKLWRIPAPGSRPAHLCLDNDDNGLPCPHGEKILRPKKSDLDTWAFVSPLIVLHTAIGTAVGVSRLKMVATAKIDDDQTTRYQTVFSLYRIDETAW